MSLTNRKRRRSDTKNTNRSRRRQKKEKTPKISWNIDSCYKRNAQEIFRELVENEIIKDSDSSDSDCDRQIIPFTIAQFAASEYKNCEECNEGPFLLMDEDTIDAVELDALYEIIWYVQSVRKEHFSSYSEM